MAGYVVFVFFACFGLLSVLWTLLGWLLPGDAGAMVICLGMPDVGLLSRYRWLRSLGFLRCPLVAVMEEYPRFVPRDTEICSREQLISRLEQEWNICHGTGNGDSSGNHQRGGLPEL